jgi:aspartate/methionine/tyrosine aminotransferase
MAPLRKALAAYLQAAGYQALDVANILVTAGMQETRFLSLQILGRLLGPVAVPDVVHPGAHKALGVRPLQVAPALPTERAAGFLASVRGIEAALRGGAKVLYLESPVRLTGAVYDKQALTRIAELATQFQAAVIWDQGLAPWVSGYVSIWNEPGMAQRAVLLSEAFPGVGLESWYIGFLATNPEWFEKIRRDKQAISICTCTADQLAAIKSAETYAATHARQLAELAGLWSSTVRAAGGKALPGAAASVVAVPLPDPFAAVTLRKAGFGFADGADFGARGIIRLAVTPDNAIADAIGCLR